MNNMPELKPGMLVKAERNTDEMECEYILGRCIDGTDRKHWHCTTVDTDYNTHIYTDDITEVYIGTRRELCLNGDIKKTWRCVWQRPSRTMTIPELIASHEAHTGEKVWVDVRSVLEPEIDSINRMMCEDKIYYSAIEELAKIRGIEKSIKLLESSVI